MRLTEFSSSRTQWHKHNKFPAPNGARFHRTNQPETCHTRYDAMNRRVRKYVGNGGVTGNIPNGTTDYIWLGSQVMEERNPFGGSGSTDTPIRQYIWGTYIDECIQLTTLATLGPQSLPAGAYYLLQDLLYRAVALTNSSGAIVEAYDTDAYGNTLIFTGPGADGVWFTDDDVQSSFGANNIIYCGYNFDPETQLYYVRNRTYAPALGRWIQRDPIGYAGGINLYDYAGSRPLVVADPNGALPWWTWFFIPITAWEHLKEKEQFCDQLRNWCERMVAQGNASCDTINFCQREFAKCGFNEAVNTGKAIIKSVPGTGAHGYILPGGSMMTK